MVGLLLLMAKGRAEWRWTWRHCIVRWDGRLYAARARAEGRYLRSATSETVRPRLEQVESHAVKNTLLRVIRYVKKSLEE